MADELEELEKLRASLRPVDDAPLRAARASLLREATNGSTRRATAWRPRIAVLAATAVSCTLVLVATLPVLLHTGPPSTLAELGKRIAAAAQPAPVARAGEYSYVENTVYRDGQLGLRAQDWIPADGVGAQEHRLWVGGQYTKSGVSCTPRGVIDCQDLPELRRGVYDYLVGLPTEVSSLRQRVFGQVKPGADQDLDAAKLVITVLRDQFVPRPQQAALVQVLATIPGTSLVGQVRDASGREGLGVRAANRSGTDYWTLVLAPGDYRVLGVNADGEPAGQRQDVVRVTAGLVGAVGQTP
ncbi:hypothetical protein GCM10010174_41860 [Kutzneria viridogrisea]|uniref:Uncharacterized protein n=2 Tax=Kutzneria TaxID=43356 RepID=A0ABR6BSA3_9PSEU|nr:CU044_5270 family protein [Kutzneria albida]AHH94130.1 putative membrane protein [Kutzneria albida DSM 43870]MBA8929803.1 hypothetical protein [Kutzneria viridogrisea]